jgi:hypothetical protein
VFLQVPSKQNTAFCVFYCRNFMAYKKPFAMGMYHV